jgi:anti-anti-sigma factor
VPVAAVPAATHSLHDLAVTTSCSRHVTVVEVSGDIDLLTAPELANRIGQCLAEGTPLVVVVDLRGVDFVGASGLSVLLEAHWRAHAQRSTVRVVANTPAVCRALTVTELDRTLAVYPALEPALKVPLGWRQRRLPRMAAQSHHTNEGEILAQGVDGFGIDMVWPTALTGATATTLEIPESP